jgi:hypothetical protein
MIKRKFGIIVILLCLCVHLMPYQAMAASTSDAVESIQPEKECSLTISYCYGETAFSGVEVKLYQIADVSADFHYTLTSMFADSGLILEGIRTNGEWNVVRSTLEAHILADNIAPEFTAVTNEAGQVRFDGLKTGMYLAIVGQIQQGELYYQFDSALVAVPGLGTDGRWQYQVSVNAKGEALPPVESDETIELKVLKLWRGDEKRNDRPQSVEVEIFCNGESYETVILSEENNWTYTWAAKDDGSNWAVVERNVPQGYTMTVEQRPTTFVVTNTWPDDPENPPQTGDTANLLLYVLLMGGSGSLLVIVGITGKKPRV